MRLDTKAMRYLTAEDWKVLTAVSELFSQNIFSEFIEANSFSGRDRQQKP
jgi:hypothetical protein